MSHVATLEEDDEDIIGEFAKQYEAGVRLEDKAENYMRKGSQPVIEEDEAEERSDEMEDLED